MMTAKSWLATTLAPYVALAMMALAVSHVALAFEDPAPHSVTSQMQWIEKAWTGDEAPYREARATVDRIKSAGKLDLEKIQTYKALYAKNPSDSAALYRWVYATFQATQMNPPLPQKEVVSPGVFDEVPSPHTYEYDRVRFLVWAHYIPDTHLQPLGERLLAHSPNDDDVKYYLIQCYKPWRSTSEKAKAIALAQDLVRSAPRRPGSYSALGGVYFGSWMVSHQKEDADKAVSAYRDYLRIAPQNYAWRQQAEKIIQYVSSRSAAAR